MNRLAILTLTASLLSGLLHVDQDTAAATQRLRTPLADRLMRGATELGRRDVMVWGLLAIAAFGGPEGPVTARVALVSLAGTNLVVEGLKRAVVRTRPDGDRNPDNSSFPSGHAASAVSLAVVLAWRWRRWTAAFWLLAVIVCVSRIYLNRHFLSDVLCGVAIGLLCTWLVFRLWPGLRVARPAAATAAGRGGPAAPA